MENHLVVSYNAKYMHTVQNSNYNPGASQTIVIKNPPVDAGDVKDVGSIPGLGKSLGGGHGKLV